jgi:hypothetical protein
MEALSLLLLALLEIGQNNGDGQEGCKRTWRELLILIGSFNCGLNCGLRIVMHGIVKAALRNPSAKSFGSWSYMDSDILPVVLVHGRGQTCVSVHSK